MVLGPRFLWAHVCSFFTPQVPIEGPVTRKFTILPFLDCETGITLNAAKYHVLAEIVQLECNSRSGFTWAGIRGGVWAITLSNTIYYRRPVRSFSRVAITVELYGWDERFWVWQNIFRNSRGEICAVSYTKVAGKSKKGLEPSSKAFEVMGQTPRLKELRTDVDALFANLETVAKKTLSDQATS